jgi:hypothetical protein
MLSDVSLALSQILEHGRAAKSVVVGVGVVLFSLSTDRTPSTNCVPQDDTLLSEAEVLGFPAPVAPESVVGGSAASMLAMRLNPGA